MRIYLCCPECGNTNWIFNKEEDAFECGACGELCYTEDMGAVTSEGDELY
ncbi:MAG: hypothetical protein J5725_06420 [Bacteroidales bacterium]|nr:hypothetical protein [Bacteroidales bacterium]